MKTIILITLTAGLVFASCKKSVDACNDYKEISGRETLIDPQSVDSKEVKDTLLKYPQLELYKISSDAFGSTYRHHVYYKELLIFSDEYIVNKMKNTGHVSSNGKLLNIDLNISLEPKVGFKEAINTTKSYVNFDHSCVSYQLGLYNVGGTTVNYPDRYLLAWKVTDSQKAYIYAIVDAVTGRVIARDNGIRFVN